MFIGLSSRGDGSLARVYRLTSWVSSSPFICFYSGSLLKNRKRIARCKSISNRFYIIAFERTLRATAPTLPYNIIFRNTILFHGHFKQLKLTIIIRPLLLIINLSNILNLKAMRLILILNVILEV